MGLRATTYLVSLVLHAALGWYAVRAYEASAYAAGAGADEFNVEQAIAIENITSLGLDMETAQAVEAEPVEPSVAHPEVEKAKAEEEVIEDQVIASETGPEQEREPVKEAVQIEQAAAPDQVAVAPQEPKFAVGEKKEGGDASALKAYDGKLFAHLTRHVVHPSGRRNGRVVVRFIIDRAGRVLSREVAESSGIQRLDEAAVSAIDRAAPFPPIPAEVTEEPLVRTAPFKFN